MHVVVWLVCTWWCGWCARGSVAVYMQYVTHSRQVLPAGCLVQQLVEWVCWAGREGERERLQDILDHTPPESHGDYWTMVYRLVLTGRLSEARNLLAQHSATGSMERVRVKGTRTEGHV